jgi:hypothetical protein
MELVSVLRQYFDVPVYSPNATKWRKRIGAPQYIASINPYGLKNERTVQGMFT